MFTLIINGRKIKWNMNSGVKKNIILIKVKEELVLTYTQIDIPVHTNRCIR